MTKVTINTETTKKTYKPGDFFLVDGELSLLAKVDRNNLCALIYVRTGNRWEEPISVLNTEVVTREELNKMAHDVNIQYLDSVSITY